MALGGIKMTENNMQELLDAYDQQLAELEIGKTIEGTIHAIGDDEVVIELDHMFDGVVAKSEMEADAQPGQRLTFAIMRIDDERGQVILSRKEALEAEVFNEIEEQFEKGGPITVKVLEVVKGGLRISIGKIRGFMPFSQIDVRRTDEAESYIGKFLEAQIIEWSPDDRNLLVSRRALLEKKQKSQEDEFFETLEVDSIHEGKVFKIFSAGALIDLGKALGYLHVSDASWYRITNMEDAFKVGDLLTVQVKSFDPETRKISLSLKNMTVNPWEVVEQNFAIGDVAYGKIVKKVPTGLLIELETGITGYIHESHMAGVKWKLDDEIAVEVESIDRNSERMSLRYFDESTIADEFEQDTLELDTIGDLFGDILDKIK
jgi:small subunit ribosomal protein S1